jgi:hypothetical protein
LIDTVHVENVNVPSTRDGLRRRFSILPSLVRSGGFILGLNCIAYRFGSGDFLLRRGLLTPNGGRRNQDKHRDGGATPNGVFHTGICFVLVDANGIPGGLFFWFSICSEISDHGTRSS